MGVSVSGWTTRFWVVRTRTYEVVGLKEAVDDALPGLSGSSDDEHEWLGAVGHVLRWSRIRSSCEDRDRIYTLFIPNCGADKQPALSGSGLRTGGYVQGRSGCSETYTMKGKKRRTKRVKRDARCRRVALQVLHNHITQLGVHCIPRHFCVEGGDSIWHALSAVGS